jgi:DNA polymerase
MTTLNIDFETASAADLKRTGAYVYAKHPTTRVLCMGYAFDDGPVQSWRIGQPFPVAVLAHVAQGGTVKAWNAAFEYNIWNETLARQLLAEHAARAVPALSLAQLHDTMASAAYYGLPLSLDMAAKAAHVHVRKDKDGHSLMLRMCRPRKTNPDGTYEWWHETDPAKFDTLVVYCENDVATERAVGNALPLPLPDAERAVWLLDQRINQRGIGVDTNLVARLQELAAMAAQQGNAEMDRLTGGAVKTVTSAAALLAFLKGIGYPHDDLKKGTVAARLDNPACQGLERQLLELRADVAKTSAAKLGAMLSASDAAQDGVALVRGMLQYYGAMRTGRWAGRLIQLQNMPRGTLSHAQMDAAVAMILGAGDTATVYAALEALYGSVMGVVSSLLRACLVPVAGTALAVADFAQIEARVLAWLAGQQDILEAFRNGEDVYVRAAAGIFGVPENQVTKDQRQIGKIAVLALGYQGGKGAFQIMAAAYGVDVDDKRADEIKTAWRIASPDIVNFWWAMDAASREVIANPNQIVTVGPIKVGMVGPHMVIVLPSGRALWYRDTRLIAGDTGRMEVSYMGVDQYTRQWTRLRTYGGKLVENITQAVARDVMAAAMLEADKKGHEIVLTVHDELLTAAPANNADNWLKDLEQIMAQPPVWAQGLPTGADGWHGPRYKK